MKRVFSGIQPTGNLSIGNYLGAMKQFVEMQDDYECFYCVVDLHALTVMPTAQSLHEGTLDLAALYYAVGIDPHKANLFLQSHVSEHSELSWLLQCISYFGELSRMTQFKDKKQLIESSKKGSQSITAGLFSYPVLMAADILLYDTEVVPVGQDQKQHVELARNIANRANQLIKDGVFVVPEPLIPKVGAKIMSLRDPSRKMSKSDPVDASRINMLDTPEAVMTKFKKAKTDSENLIKYDPVNKRGVSNLLEIQSLCTNKPISVLEAEYENSGYGKLKTQTAEAVIEFLKPIQERYYELRNSSEMLEYLKLGADNARKIARKTLTRYQNALGLVSRD